jgi:uncharacterized protein YvpB
MSSTLRVTASVTTWLKPSRADASTIVTGLMVPFKVGESYPVVSVGPLVKSHYLLTLGTLLQGYTQWYVYANHVAITGKSASVNLNIPYYPQYDNRYQPNTSCFATSAAMALAYHGIKPRGGEALEDELYLYMQDHGYDRFSWGDMAALIKVYGCKPYADMSGTFSDITAALDKGMPVIIGTYFTHAGHIVLVKGYDGKGLICHDPWGLALGGGMYDLTKDGKDVHYSWSMVAADASDVGGTDPTDLWIMPVGK